METSKLEYYGNYFYPYLNNQDKNALMKEGRRWKDIREDNYKSSCEVNWDKAFIVGFDYPSKDGFFKAFTAFDNFVDFVKWFSLNDQPIPYYYEIMTQDKRRGYFDLDVKGKSYEEAEEIKDAVISAIKDVINYIANDNKYFAKELNVKPFTISNDIILCTSHGMSGDKMKYSYHIILPRFYLNDGKACKEFCILVKQKLPNNYREYVDEAVYGKNGQFRMVGSSKFVKPEDVFKGTVKQRIKKISYEWKHNGETIKCGLYDKVKDYINGTDERDKYFLNLLEFEFTLISGNGSVPIPIFEKPKSTFIKDNVELSEEEIKQAFTNMISSFSWDDGDFSIRKCEGSTIFLNRNKANFCPVCQRNHENENPFISVGKTCCYYHCRRVESSAEIKKVAFASIYPPVFTVETNTEVDKRESVLLPDKPEEPKINEVENPTNNKREKEAKEALEYYKQMTDFTRYIDENTEYIETDGKNKEGKAYGKIDAFPTDKDTIFINAPCGAGKTEQIINFVKEPFVDFVKENKIKSFAYLSTRRTFATSVSQRLNDRGVEVKNYLENEELNECPYVMISGESLHKYNTIPELVIIDESTAFFKQIDGATYKKNKKENYAVLKSLVENANYVIVLDAYLDNRSIDFIKGIRSGKSVIINHTFDARNDYTFKELPAGKEVFNSCVIEEAKKGKKLLVPVSTPKIADNLEEALMKEGINNILKIHGHTSNYEKELQNVNEWWKGFQIVIFTSTINVGIDFSEEYFDACFCYCSARCGTPVDYLQMINRARILKEKVIYVSFNYQEMKRSPYTFEEINEIVANIVRCGNKQIAFASRFEFNDDDLNPEDLEAMPVEGQVIYDLKGKRRIRFIVKDDVFTRLRLQNWGFRSLSRSFFKDIFIYVIQKYGFNYTVLPSISKEAKKELNENYKKIDEERKAKLVIEFENAPVLNEDKQALLKLKIQSGSVLNPVVRDDKITDKKNYLLNQIKEDKRHLITGEDILKLDENIRQIRNIRLENKTYDDIMKMTTGGDIIGDVSEIPFLLSRYSGVKKLCNILGIPNTYESHILECQQIRDKVDEIACWWDEFKDVFKLWNKRPEKDSTKVFINVKGIINSVFGGWSGMELKEIKQQQRKGKRYYTYQIAGSLSNYVNLIDMFNEEDA